MYYIVSGRDDGVNGVRQSTKLDMTMPMWKYLAGQGLFMLGEENVAE